MAFESLHIGTTAMQSAQNALSVIGHNLANLNTEGYSRQRALLESNHPLDKYPGQRGTGVHVEEIERVTDNFTKLQLNEENQKFGEYSTKSDILDEVEQVLNEPTETGLQALISDFFNAFQTLANSPEEVGTRTVVLEKALAITQRLNSVSGQLQDIQTQADELVTSRVTEVNNISERIAALNERISAVEVTEGQNANDLRDDRDLLLKDLSKIINVTSYEDNNRNLFVEAQGTVLVAATKSVPMTTSRNAQGFLVPANAVTQHPVNITSGEFKGLLDARDNHINELINDLDEFSLKLINEVNSIHAAGTTKDGFSSITGGIQVTPTASLYSAVTNAKPQTGNLYITAYNESTGSMEERSIPVYPLTDTLNDLVTNINTAFSGEITASVDAGRLRIDGNSGYKVFFTEATTGNTDTSGTLAALGVNTFFEGTSAYTINVKNNIQNNVNEIAAGKTLSPGDNQNALLISELSNKLVLNNDSSTFVDYYSSLVSEIGTDVQVTSNNYENQDALVQLLEERLSSIAGVNVDEEAANLIIYQRMFQAAAKYVQIMDSVMNTLIQGII